MSTSIILDGLTWASDDFANRGHLDTVTVEGAAYPRWQGLFVAALAQISTNIATTGAVLTDTSSSSVAIGSGSKTFTVSASKGFSTGMWVVVADAANPTTRYMAGSVTSYSGTTLVISVPASGVVGSGTVSSWLVGVGGTPGAIGLTWRGAWSNATAYVANDAVQYNGNAYFCLLAHTGQAPPLPPTTANTYWSMLALGATVSSTSSTSLPVGGGSKTLTTDTALSLGVGAFVQISSAATPTNWMYGQISSISGTSVTVTVSTSNGSGTISSWVISSSAGPVGPSGNNKIMWGGTAGGTADALVVSTGLSISTAQSGHNVIFISGSNSNTGAATLSVDTSGVINLRSKGSALVAGDIAPNTVYSATFDGTYWELWGGANVAPIYIGTATSISADSRDYLTDTTATGFTITLPAAPTTGANCTFLDAAGTWGAHNLTLGRNGNTIESAASDLVCDVSGAKFTLWYNGATWKVVSNIPLAR